MLESEGTLQFHCDLRAAQPDDFAPRSLYQRLEAWRHLLLRLRLLGRDPERYGGYAYGNLSARDPSNASRFYITASQMTDRDFLERSALTRIDSVDLDRFAVSATGQSAPSSETITHAMVYRADPGVSWVFHVHSADVFHSARQLSLATIPASIGYGSPALARAVAVLLRIHNERPLLFATLGHEDGVFACGADADELGAALVTSLARATAPACP